MVKKPRKWAIGRVLEVKITMILKFFKAIWAVFDVIYVIISAPVGAGYFRYAEKKLKDM